MSCTYTLSISLMVKLLASVTASFAVLGSGDAFQPPATSVLQWHGGKIDTKTLLQSTIINGETPTEISTDDKPTIAADTDTQRSKTPEFDWFKAWHPIVPIEFLDNEKPHKFKLLGMDIVIWNDGPIDTESPKFQSRKDRPKGAKKVDGNWRCFVDQCPHRKGMFMKVLYLCIRCAQKCTACMFCLV